MPDKILEDIVQDVRDLGVSIDTQIDELQKVRRRSTWKFCGLLVLILIMAVGLIQVIQVTDDQKADRRHDDIVQHETAIALCRNGNARRTDIKVAFLAVLHSIDPTFKSPLWTYVPDVDGPGPEHEYPGLEALLSDKLGPTQC
jgi:hypothetical protein